MKPTAIITVIALASSALAVAIEKRTYDVVLYTCPTAPGVKPVSDADMAKAYSYACIKTFHCAHSIAPALADNEWIGSCLSCPNSIPEAYDGCILAPQ
ncbi:hypothetical protein EsH8_I_001332 [Colletotrichum jinshuiense]